MLKEKKKDRRAESLSKMEEGFDFAFRQLPTVQKYYETIVTGGKWEGGCRRVGDSGDGGRVM